MSRSIHALQGEFDMKDMGNLHYFLGISVHRSSSGMFLSQQKYAAEILARVKTSNCNPCITPADTKSKLSATSGSPVADSSLYRSISGALQYLTFTRPDICYPMQHVCLIMYDPREPQFIALKRIIRYLKGTLHHGPTLHRLHLFRCLLIPMLILVVAQIPDAPLRVTVFFSALISCLGLAKDKQLLLALGLKLNTVELLML